MGSSDRQGRRRSIWRKGEKSRVFSKQARTASLNPEFIDELVAEFAKRLRQTEGKNTWMMGGSGLIASFPDPCGSRRYRPGHRAH
jgi:dihydrofolate reductase